GVPGHARFGFIPFPLVLTIPALEGLLVISWKLRGAPRVTRYLLLAGGALLLGSVIEILQLLASPLVSSPGARLTLFEIGEKLGVYWGPYFLTLFAAIPFALAYSRWSRPISLFVLLAVLTFPFTVTDPDQGYWLWHYQGHSFVEQMAFDLRT